MGSQCQPGSTQIPQGQLWGSTELWKIMYTAGCVSLEQCGSSIEPPVELGIMEYNHSLTEAGKDLQDH